MALQKNQGPAKGLYADKAGLPKSKRKNHAQTVQETKLHAGHENQKHHMSSNDLIRRSLASYDAKIASYEVPSPHMRSYDII